jgi:PilZ domain
MRVPSGRTEKRSASAVPVGLSPLDLSRPAESTVTENISPRGARVVSKQQWQEGDRVMLKTLARDLRWQAKVVYCEILPSSTFALGLKLLTAPDRWESGINGRATRGNKRTRMRRSKFQASNIRFPSVTGSLSSKGRP